MSTRSRIGVVNPDGTITSIYCHSDGYLEGPHGVGHKLVKFYNLPATVKALMALGDLSSLGELLAPLDGGPHSYDRPVGGVCVAYGRDRKEGDTKAMVSKNRTEFQKLFEEYNYLFRDGAWYVLGGRKADDKLIVVVQITEAFQQ